MCSMVQSTDMTTKRGKPRTRRPYGLSPDDTTRWFLDRAEPAGDCLITHTARTAKGYGLITYQGSRVYLHRLVLEAKLGRALCADEMARHSCHRPACINPDHLSAGSAQDNSNDMKRAERSMRGAAHPLAKMDYQKAMAIRRRFITDRVSMRALAGEYGVSPMTISRVIRWLCWADEPS